MLLPLCSGPPDEPLLLVAAEPAAAASNRDLLSAAVNGERPPAETADGRLRLSSELLRDSPLLLLWWLAAVDAG